jgi:hypothetical protein
MLEIDLKDGFRSSVQHEIGELLATEYEDFPNNNIVQNNHAWMCDGIETSRDWNCVSLKDIYFTTINELTLNSGIMPRTQRSAVITEITTPEQSGTVIGMQNYSNRRFKAYLPFGSNTKRL